MTKKTPRLDEDLQKDLLDKPLRCLEGVSFGSMTMNEGIEIMARIAEEINGYLDTSPVAQTLQDRWSHETRSWLIFLFPLKER